MNKCLYLTLLILISNCKTDNYRYYKDVIDKPIIDINHYADFITPTVEANSIKSIKAYKYNDGEIYFISEDSIIEDGKPLYFLASYKYNKKGNLIQLNEMYEKYSKPRKYTFAYNNLNQLAYHTFSYNGYDTIYSVLYYNDKGDCNQEIEINNKRSELHGFKQYDISYDQNSIKSTIYDYAHDTLLIFRWHNTISIKNDEIVKTRYRILIEDTTYNRFPDEAVYSVFNQKLYITSYKSDDVKKEYKYTFYPNGKLKLILAGTDSTCYNSQGDIVLQVDKYYRKKYEYTYDSNGNWITRKYSLGNKTKEVVKRFIDYYSDETADEKPDFEVSKHIFKKADSLCLILPQYAKNKALKIEKRLADINDGNFGKAIDIKSGKSIREFLPKYWTLITSDSGHLKPYDSMVIVAGYNTTISSNESNEFKRCLAIYEKKNNTLYLKEQSYSAIEPYRDQSVEATAYKVSIEVNCITIFYQYMHTEISYTFEYDFKQKDWRLIGEWSSNRSYTNAEVKSYDYKKCQLHFENYPLGEDSKEREIDTIINVKKKFLNIYMNIKDSIQLESDTVFIKGLGTIYF